MTIKIPMVMRSAAKNAGLAGWADSRKCPLREYFESIDGYRRIFRRHLPGAAELDYEVLALNVASLLHHEETLYEYLVGEHRDTTSPDDWKQLCDAAAWVILTRYDKALRTGTWPPRAP